MFDVVDSGFRMSALVLKGYEHDRKDKQNSPVYSRFNLQPEVPMTKNQLSKTDEI